MNYQSHIKIEAQSHQNISGRDTQPNTRQAMKDITFGQYYPINSVVHRMDARTKILLVVVYITMIFFIVDFIIFAWAAVFVVLATLISKVPIGSMLRSIRPIIYIMVFTVIMSVLFYKPADGTPPIAQWWIIHIYKQGLMTAGKMACRLILLVLGPTLLTLTTTPKDLTNGIESLLKPLTLIRIPVQEFALIMSIALRFIPILAGETDKIVSVQKARCADFDSKNLIKKAKSMLPVLIPLFVSSFKRADELADAIDSRCYGYTRKRTKLNNPKFHIRDLMAVLFIGVFFALILIIRYNWLPIYEWLHIKPI